MIKLALWLAVSLFPISEIGLAFVKRSRGQGVNGEDRGSLRLLWLSVALGVGLAVTTQWVPSARLPGSPHALRVLALVLLSVGLALRWAAILTLGRLFTVDVAIHADHAVVQSGFYRFVRHPSYTGLLVAFLGLGIFFGSWLSVLALLVPIGAAVVNRVATEERALLAALGPSYASYRARTKRFVPGLF